jgi:predicted regulator of Ras-like GTPase activity (Roadblock/LC7/MglB family)
VTTETDLSMRHLIDQVVDGVPGVTGALIASADGFVLAARLPDHVPLDAAAIAAMSAATLGLATRLVGLGGTASADVSVHRSTHAQVFVFSVGGAAALTVLADYTADTALIERVGHEVSIGLARAFQS